MEVLLINGSPRTDGNTIQLMNRVAEAARSACPETTVTTYHLNSMDFQGCQGCLGCKDERATGCVLQDDLTEALEAMLEADAVIVGIPVYMGHVTGQYKCFWDRLYGFITQGGENRLPAGKKGVVAVTQGVADVGHYQAMIDLVTGSLGRRGLQVETVVAGGTKGSARGDIRFTPATEARAQELGRWLAP